MNPQSYVVRGAAGHFVDECMTVRLCIRCDRLINRSSGWATIAQVISRKAPQPPWMCGGVLCAPCRSSFLQWIESRD